MTKNREKRLLEAKKKEWNESLCGFNRFMKRVKKESKNFLDWYLFFQPHDKTDRIWHFIEIILMDFFFLKIFGLI